MAKHTTTFQLKDFITKSRNLVNPHGKLAVILPADVSEQFLKMALEAGFRLNGLLRIIPREGKPVNRMVQLFSLKQSENQHEESLVIRDANGQYTSAYKLLTADFHAEGYI